MRGRSLARAALVIAVAVGGFPAAAIGASVQEFPDLSSRATSYWQASPACPGGPQLRVDQARVAAAGAAALSFIGGCEIIVGDAFVAADAGLRCAIITHEWGHLLGYGHVAVPADPVGVMTSDRRSVQCLLLDVPVVRAWLSYNAKIADRIGRAVARSECTFRASERRTRAARVAARRRCVRRYGRILREPQAPGPRPPIEMIARVTAAGLA